MPDPALVDSSPVAQRTLRPARVDETEQITDLALRSKALWGYSREFMAACREELTITAEYLDRRATWVIEGPDGQVSGFYSLARLDDYEVELDMLYVDPDRVGHGLGRRLFEHAREQAREQGFHTMEIQADPNAEAFYRRMGAVTVGTKPSLSIPGRDLPLMRLVL